MKKELKSVTGGRAKEKTAHEVCLKKE